MYRILLSLLLVFSPFLYSAPSTSSGQYHFGSFERVSTRKPVPKDLKYGLWATAYVGSIYLLSRLSSADLALGTLYAVPALLPFYQWDSQQSTTKELGFTGENLIFASLSLYNFFVVKPESQSGTKIFQDNLLLNLGLWTGLLYFRQKTEQKAYIIVPVLAKNSTSIYLKASF